MHIAIDIGARKTVIFSTIDGGSVVFDEFGNREFGTVLALVTPVRTFGKAVAGDSPEQLQMRRRGFFQNITDEDAQCSLFMYFEYLARIIKLNYDEVVLTIPEYFGAEERSIVRSIAAASSLRVGGFLTHLTSVAASAVLKNREYPERFVIVDFGYHKCSIGLFEHKEQRLTPLRQAVLRRGAADFDEAIFDILVNKYRDQGLSESLAVRERLLGIVCKLKRGLNELESVHASVFGDKFETVKVELKKDEFLARVRPILDEIRGFIDGFFKDTGFVGKVEVVGNNFNSVFIKEIMEPYAHSTMLSPTDSAALGACLAFGVNARNIQYRIDEIAGHGISARVQGQGSDAAKGSKHTVSLFKENAVINTVVNVKYHRREAFVVEVLEGDRVVGLVHINKEATPGPETVKIAVKMNDFGLVSVTRVTAQADDEEEPRPVDFTYENLFELSKEMVEKLREAESKFAVIEDEFIRTSELRHLTESYIDKFISMVDKSFPALLASEDRDRIDDITDRFFSTSGGSYEGEQRLREKLFEDLRFVEEKLLKEEAVIRTEADELAAKAEPYKGRAEFMRVFGLLAMLKRNLKLTLGEFMNYDGGLLERLRQEFEMAVAMAKIADEEKIKKESESKDAAADACGDSCCADECSKKCPDGCSKKCSNEHSKKCPDGCSKKCPDEHSKKCTKDNCVNN